MSIPRRPYRGDVTLSIVGFGAIVVCKQSQADADAIVAEAIDRGVNYFDVAPSYFHGEAEKKLGIALEGKREGIFLACKTTERSAEGARRELERSLRRLHTDHFDLYQLHAVESPADIDRILGPGGAAETFLAAQQAGQVRHIGFSVHSIEAGLKLMKEAPFPIDSVLMPLNFASVVEGGFGPKLLAEAKARGIARLALKALAHQRWPEGARRTHRKTWYQPIAEAHLASLALRWTLSHDITAAIPPGEVDIFRIAMDVAENYRPLRDDERAEIEAHAAGLTPVFDHVNNA